MNRRRFLASLGASVALAPLMAATPPMAQPFVGEWRGVVWYTCDIEFDRGPTSLREDQIIVAGEGA
jgi:hypothetical protein